MVKPAGKTRGNDGQNDYKIYDILIQKHRQSDLIYIDAL
jgi:hypothetical protein